MEQKSKMWLYGVKDESGNISMERKMRRAEEAARDRDLGYLVCCNKESLTLFRVLNVNSQVSSFKPHYHIIGMADAILCQI